MWQHLASSALETDPKTSKNRKNKEKISKKHQEIAKNDPKMMENVMFSSVFDGFRWILAGVEDVAAAGQGETEEP